MSSATNPEPQRKPQREEEHQGPIWKHPYFAYILVTVAIFGFLIVAAWLALENGWVPKR